MTVDCLCTAESHLRAYLLVEGQQNIYPLLTSYKFLTPILTSLFPFPKDMCPRMALVNPDFREGRTGMESVVVPATEGFMDWIFNEFNLDYLNMLFVG